MPRICYISPYLPNHFGGGEKYILDCALVSSKKIATYVGIPGERTASELEKIKANYQNFFGSDLSAISFVNTPLFTAKSFFQKLWWTKQFSHLYFETDGSLFFSLARRNILHIQVPLQRPPLGWLERIKLQTWQVVNTNSYFTKKQVQKIWKIQVDFVHQPMVAQEHLAGLEKRLAPKKPIILHVGRFFKQLHSKRQDALVEMFAQLCHQVPEIKKKWKLILVGSVEDKTYASEIQNRITQLKLPIELIHSATRSELDQLYGQASIYWHATGLDVDQDHSPQKVEHFGISTVEAMANGVIPVVINKGGQPEILGKVLGQKLLWNTPQEAIQVTQEIICNPEYRKQLSELCKERAKQFNGQLFEKILWDMLEIK